MAGAGARHLCAALPDAWALATIHREAAAAPVGIVTVAGPEAAATAAVTGAMPGCRASFDRAAAPRAAGGFFGGKHRTTVLHSIRKIESDRARDREIDEAIAKISQSLL